MAAQLNIVNDIGNAVRVPGKVMDTLIDTANYCIGSAIHDAILSGEPTTVLNIGIGSLSINLADMQCKFIPSKDLKQTIRKSIDEKLDPLEINLEDTLIQKLLAIYDEER